MYRKLSFLFLLIAFAEGNDDGQYRPGKYGDEGRYVPGDEGRYVHETEGRIDNSRGQSGPLRQGNNRFQSNFAGSDSQFINRFVVDTASSNLSPFSQLPSFRSQNNIAAAASNTRSNFGGISAFSHGRSSPEGHYRILKQDGELNPDSYYYVYETENNIKAEENGRLVNANTKNEGIAATGFYEYIGPDNVKYRVDYIADENGFQPVGAHLPTPPPIPEAIAKILVDVGKK